MVDSPGVSSLFPLPYREIMGASGASFLACTAVCTPIASNFGQGDSVWYLRPKGKTANSVSEDDIIERIR